MSNVKRLHIDLYSLIQVIAAVPELRDEMRRAAQEGPTETTQPFGNINLDPDGQGDWRTLFLATDIETGEVYRSKAGRVAINLRKQKNQNATQGQQAQAGGGQPDIESITKAVIAAIGGGQAQAPAAAREPQRRQAQKLRVASQDVGGFEDIPF